MPRHTLRLIVIGGQAHRNPPCCPFAQIECFSSTRDGGNGDIRRAVARIRSGSVDGVVIRADFIGHSAFKTIRKVCKRCGLAVRVVSGGHAGAMRALKGIVTQKRGGD